MGVWEEWDIILVLRMVVDDCCDWFVGLVGIFVQVVGFCFEVLHAEVIVESGEQEDGGGKEEGFIMQDLKEVAADDAAG